MLAANVPKLEESEIGPTWWNLPFHLAYENFGNSNRHFWKRLIAWERSRAASAYGIIWGEGGGGAVKTWQKFNSAKCYIAA